MRRRRRLSEPPYPGYRSPWPWENRWHGYPEVSPKVEYTCTSITGGTTVPDITGNGCDGTLGALLAGNAPTLAGGSTYLRFPQINENQGGYIGIGGGYTLGTPFTVCATFDLDNTASDGSLRIPNTRGFMGDRTNASRLSLCINSSGASGKAQILTSVASNVVTIATETTGGIPAAGAVFVAWRLDRDGSYTMWRRNGDDGSGTNYSAGASSTTAGSTVIGVSRLITGGVTVNKCLAMNLYYFTAWQAILTHEQIAAEYFRQKSIVNARGVSVE